MFGYEKPRACNKTSLHFIIFLRCFFVLKYWHCRTAEVITLLARILIEYINPSSEESKQRLQLIAKMNGASYLAKSLRSQLQIYDGSAVMNNSLATLIKVTLLVGGVDGRFYLKVRFGGLLALAANVIATREGKNAALLSKNEKFVLFIKSTFKDYANEEMNVIHRCAELLYLMAKPKSTRLILVSNGIVQSVMELFQAFFAKEEETAWTVCMAALGTVRLLTSTMAGRQTLVECNGLTIFRESVKSFNAAEQSNRNCSFLYHAMSSLCLRCLPMCRLPVNSMEHPVTVHLPVTRTTCTPADTLSDSEEELSIAAGFLTDVLTSTDDESMVVQKPGPEGPPSHMKLFQSEVHLYRFLCRELEFGMDKNTELANRTNLDVDETVEFSDTIRKCLPRRRRNSLSEVSGLRFSTQTKDKNGAEKVLYTSLGRRASLDNGPRPDPVWYNWMDYVFQAASTHSVYPFATIAFPDYHGLYPNLSRQRLKFYPNTLLKMLEPLIDRVEAESFPAKVVYDLDALLKEPKPEVPARSLLSDDLIRLGKVDAQTTSLKFESLWNMVSNVPYTFNIINCVKTRSLYNSGMQPVVFSVTEALLGRPGWVRSGRSCVYYRNFYSRSHAKVVARSKAPQTITSYYTASFTLHFRHAYDMCYFAYHYPYTYTMMKTHLMKLSQLLSGVSDVRFRIDTLCRSIAGNPVKLLTITDAASCNVLQERDIIVISSRVHPGESNSSWMMHGLLNYLVSPQPRACLARSLFIFKIIPMLNVDGVVNGNHRCSLAGEDLNRQWVHPEKSLFPSVYHAKNLIGYLHHIGKTPLVYCDFHGHSRKKNIFAYGNNPNLSWYSGDWKSQHQFEFYQLPEILDEISPGFHLKYCSFDIKKNKEGSARVAVWRDTSLCRAYTMEASYAGFDRGPYEGYQMTTKDLIEMGEKFIDALVCLKERIKNNEVAARVGVMPCVLNAKQQQTEPIYALRRAFVLGRACVSEQANGVFTKGAKKECDT
ncbi:cytosolic carboxypeptidase 1 [Trichuris trichiura]|uniref:Cytosolic carboxypeptidase 1 n=1 Tax=Trichuris trichiura TaxID=36087 RepID=A0A077YXD5_TRITR|nr:cytosolic carboxypeptidase 1 [Trichuris trichiura]